MPQRSKKRKVPSNYERLESLRQEKNALDAIYIRPRSSGSLAVEGQFSRDTPPPHIDVHISAVNRAAVSWERIQFGDPDRYIIRYEVVNENDSPAFAWLTRPGAPELTE